MNKFVEEFNKNSVKENPDSLVYLKYDGINNITGNHKLSFNINELNIQKSIDKKSYINNDFKSDDKFYEDIAEHCIKNDIEFESSDLVFLNIYNRIKKEMENDK